MKMKPPKSLMKALVGFIPPGAADELIKTLSTNLENSIRNTINEVELQEGESKATISIMFIDDKPTAFLITINDDLEPQRTIKAWDLRSLIASLKLGDKITNSIKSEV